MKVGAGGRDSPLVLAVLCDRSFQHLILGILRCRSHQQLGKFGPDVGGLPSRHLNEHCERTRAEGSKGWGGDTPPLMIMRTITHSTVYALGKNGGTEEALPREDHVGVAGTCVT